MITYYSADYVVPVTSAPIADGIVAVDGNGTVRGVYMSGEREIADKPVVRLKGVLIPGFVNAHCHLELSHMRGQIAEKTGLVHFLSSVITQRDASAEEIKKAMHHADQQMFEQGIQAVGDHANTGISVQIKQGSSIDYHTFVEILGMGGDVNVQAKISQAQDTASRFQQERNSLTLHAPYSCSKSLFHALKETVREHNTVSIHNQESEEENKLFLYREGEFLAFYERHGIDVSYFESTGRTSIQSYVDWLPENSPLILVHNAHTSLSDLDFLKKTSRNIFFCLCPKSNLYIEGQLPPISDFVSAGVKLVLGTDSLASNDTLDIMEEIKTICEALPGIALPEILRWATINGAEALGMDDRIGSFEVGKRPGLVLLENVEDLKIRKDSTVRRIV